MNVRLSSVAIALIAVSASAFAAEPGLTRAEVRAELEQAYARGELYRQSEYVEHINVASSKSREEVQQEATGAVESTHVNLSSGS